MDTSAAMKLMVVEAESAALAAAIDDERADLVSSLLLETEARRTASRLAKLTQERVTEFLEGISMAELEPPSFHEAGLLPGAALRSLDALHLTAAIRLGVDAVVTYDERMARAARDLGLPVVAPA